MHTYTHTQAHTHKHTHIRTRTHAHAHAPDALSIRAGNPKAAPAANTEAMTDTRGLKLGHSLAGAGARAAACCVRGLEGTVTSPTCPV